MDISNLSYKEFLSLSAKEQQLILSELENSNSKYNEFKNAKNLAEMRERQKQIEYNIYRYDAVLTNVKNRLFMPNNDEGYEIFLTEQKLNDIEEYGLTQLMINAVKSHKVYDIHSNIYMGYEYNAKRDSIEIYNDNLAFSISNIKDKLNYNFDLSCCKYAYVLHYRKLCWRNGKSFLWRLIHKRKCKIYY